MNVIYLDTSGLVKRYMTETGSVWVRNLLDPMIGVDIYIAEITGVEVVSAVARRRRTGSLSTDAAANALRDFRHDLAHQYLSIRITLLGISLAMALAEKHELRGYDAVQLAAALEVRNLALSAGVADIVFVSADMELNAAAVLEGLAVDNPNFH